VWIALLVLAGFLVGGAWSFGRQRHWGFAVVLAIGAAMAFAAGLLWAPR
jgi:hypothetical protein